MRATEHFLAVVHCCFGVGTMRSCARAMVLLSLLSVVSLSKADSPFGKDYKIEYIACKFAFKGGAYWSALVHDKYCYKRMAKVSVTKPEADDMCKSEESEATLPRLRRTHTVESLASYLAFTHLCSEGDEDKKTYWLCMQKRDDKWFWDDGSQTSKWDDSVAEWKNKKSKYCVADKHFVDRYGRKPLYGTAYVARPEGAKAFTCCQRKLNEPITKAPTTTVRTTPHYTPSRTQKDTPSKPIIYTRPDPHQPPSTTTHKPVTTKPGGNLEPKGTAGGMSRTLLLIVVFLGGGMLVAALIVIGIYLAHSKKKKRRRHHHSRRHAEPPSTTARTNPSTSAF